MSWNGTILAFTAISYRRFRSFLSERRSGGLAGVGVCDIGHRGSIVFGICGDRHGRRMALSTVVFVMRSGFLLGQSTALWVGTSCLAVFVAPLPLMGALGPPRACRSFDGLVPQCRAGDRGSAADGFAVRPLCWGLPGLLCRDLSDPGALYRPIDRLKYRRRDLGGFAPVIATFSCRRTATATRRPPMSSWRRSSLSRSCRARPRPPSPRCADPAVRSGGRPLSCSARRSGHRCRWCAAPRRTPSAASPLR
jgi:hypothetical protein